LCFIFLRLVRNLLRRNQIEKMIRVFHTKKVVKVETKIIEEMKNEEGKEESEKEEDSSSSSSSEAEEEAEEEMKVEPITSHTTESILKLTVRVDGYQNILSARAAMFGFPFDCTVSQAIERVAAKPSINLSHAVDELKLYLTNSDVPLDKDAILGSLSLKNGDTVFLRYDTFQIRGSKLKYRNSILPTLTRAVSMGGDLLSLSSTPPEKKEKSFIQYERKEERSENSPTVDRKETEKSPTPDRKEKSPSPDRKEKSPTPDRKEKSPIPERKERSPSIARTRSSSILNLSAGSLPIPSAFENFGKKRKNRRRGAKDIKYN